MMLIACDGDEIPVAMGRMKLFSQVRRRDPSTLRTVGPNSFQSLRRETAQFTTSRSVAKETPPEAGAPAAAAALGAFPIQHDINAASDAPQAH